LEINEETGPKTPVTILNINKEQKQRKRNEADEDNNASEETGLKTIATAATAIYHHKIKKHTRTVMERTIRKRKTMAMNGKPV